MSRKPRIHRPTAFYHVMLRGNNGQDIFFSDRDRCQLCLLLQEGVERFGHRIHAFCFMTNHIHLAIQPGTTSLSQIVKHFASCYAMYINRTQDRIGHLFQGRFKAILLDANNYLIELVRYIHLNPVRAGMVKRPEEYRWSSHCTYNGIYDILWVTQDWVLKKFDSHEISARKYYSVFINKGMGEQIPQDLYLAFHTGAILGDDKFREEVLKTRQEKNKIHIAIIDLLNLVTSVLNISVSALQSRAKVSSIARARAIAALLTREYTHLTIQELANTLNKDADALSKSASGLERLSLHDKKLQEMIDDLRLQLTRSYGQGLTD